MSANFSAMNRAIIEYIKANIPEDPNKAYIGTVHGSSVILKNKSYPFIPMVDLWYNNGDTVACLLPENSGAAVVVGGF